MSKVYSFEESQQVISDAWSKAIAHLKETLGDQFLYCVSDDERPDFFDKIDQDIKPMLVCPCCGEIDDEGDFMNVEWFDVPVCYDCYLRGCL